MARVPSALKVMYFLLLDWNADQDGSGALDGSFANVAQKEAIFCATSICESSKTHGVSPFVNDDLHWLA